MSFVQYAIAPCSVIACSVHLWLSSLCNNFLGYCIYTNTQYIYSIHNILQYNTVHGTFYRIACIEVYPASTCQIGNKQVGFKAHSIHCIRCGVIYAYNLMNHHFSFNRNTFLLIVKIQSCYTYNVIYQDYILTV